MDLREFVKVALRDIVAAVKEAREESMTEGEPALVSPRVDRVDGGHSVLVSSVDGGGTGFLVEFDLAVTAVETAAMGAGVSAGISVLPFTAKGKADGSTSNQQTNTQRIKFSVPVRYSQAARKDQRSRSGSGDWMS
jgi:hypothetical protein